MTVASPCTQVCTIDAASGRCAGCLRTLDEIAAWGALAPAAQRAVIGELGARRAALQRAGAGAAATPAPAPSP